MRSYNPRRPSTPNLNDHDMSDTAMQQSPTASPRQPLPTSLASFALSHSSTSSAPPSPSGSSMAVDDSYPFTAVMPSYPLHRKLRRSSLLSLGGIPRPEPLPLNGSTRGVSPINTVFPSWKDRAGSPIIGSYANESEPENDQGKDEEEEEVLEEPTMVLDEESSQNQPRNLATPPPILGPAFGPSGLSTDPIDVPQKSILKPPRLLRILSEATPSEAEFSSEASFQRLLASHAEIPVPFHPRTPRSARGRFPEEVSRDDDDENERRDLSDEDDDIIVGGPSGEGSVTDDTRWMSASPAGIGMDVDMNSYGSPSVVSSVMTSAMSTPYASGSNSNSSSSGGNHNAALNWREASSTTGRVGKRKHTGDDRYDPYGYPAAKRRAVSPSISINSGASHLLHSPPITIPHHISPGIGIPRSPISSLPSVARSVHSSPILRPVHRLPGREDKERAKQVSGAGEGVRQINLGS